ncbi:MAG TPA: hypothetical protein HA362_05710 [Nanoarchaeota archaeon]|nr:hypothetical protein [Nanoarchaeota archaeon]
MTTIEGRLFHCIGENLRHRDEVIEEYGNRFDFMRDYSFRHDMAKPIASALNLYKGGAGIVPEDIGKYGLMHTDAAVAEFEQKHGIKNFMFCMRIEESKWEALAKKMQWPEGFGAIYISEAYFSGFKSSPLDFSAFGFAIGSSETMFAHESLHMARELYSANAVQMKTVYGEVSDRECTAKLEFILTDEILAFTDAGLEREGVTVKLAAFYLDYYAKCMLFSLACPNEGPMQKETDTIGRAIEPVRKSLRLAVHSAFVLKSWLPFDVLTPLFYALGPTPKEMEASEFESPFLDLSLLAIMLQQGRIKPAAIKGALQKKGYCLERKF